VKLANKISLLIGVLVLRQAFGFNSVGRLAVCYANCRNFSVFPNPGALRGRRAADSFVPPLRG
jgi:hypothetical protein